MLANESPRFESVQQEKKSNLGRRLFLLYNQSVRRKFEEKEEATRCNWLITEFDLLHLMHFNLASVVLVYRMLLLRALPSLRNVI